MKLIDQFKTFLSSEVNLNDTRVSQLGASVEAVQKAIKTSSWGPKILDFDAHGSWAHGTIIKPGTGGEFDADLLVIVEPVEGWEAKDYVNKLGAVFDGHSTYKDKVHRYSHCVTIEYVGERRIDIAPCIKGRQWPNAYEVCNRSTNEFETTAALEYTDWVVGRNGVVGGNDLKKVTRLLKYLRDIKTNFTCPSFLFTTLVGMHIYDSDKDTAAFADTPTCLKTLMGRLDDYLQARPTVPVIRNPVLWSDIQSRVWDQTKYGNFRDKINLIDKLFTGSKSEVVADTVTPKPPVVPVLYRVQAPKAYFHNTPAESTKRDAYMIASGEKLTPIKETSDFIYIEFTNGTKLSKGWLRKKDLAQWSESTNSRINSPTGNADQNNRAAEDASKKAVPSEAML